MPLRSSTTLSTQQINSTIDFLINAAHCYGHRVLRHCFHLCMISGLLNPHNQMTLLVHSLPNFSQVLQFTHHATPWVCGRLNRFLHQRIKMRQFAIRIYLVYIKYICLRQTSISGIKTFFHSLNLCYFKLEIKYVFKQ